MFFGGDGSVKMVKKLIVILCLSFLNNSVLFGIVSYKTKYGGERLNIEYSYKLHQCVKDFRNLDYQPLVDCINLVEKIRSMREDGIINIQPHKLVKSINGRKTTELLALTKKPRDGFFGGAQGWFQKNKLSIFFRALLNSVWDDLKGNDANMLKSIKSEVEKSPNEILKEEFKPKWLNYFDGNQMANAYKVVDYDAGALRLLEGSYHKILRSAGICLRQLSPKSIFGEKEKNEFLDQCKISQIIPTADGKNLQLRFFIFTDFLNRILELAKQKDAGKLGKNEHYKTALFDFFKDVFSNVPATGSNTDSFNAYLKNIKLDQIKHDGIREGLKTRKALNLGKV